MSAHISPEMVARFTRGSLDERTAVEIARHIDSCSRCANQAALADPLSQAFASLDDPQIPGDLADDILLALQYDTPERAPAPEILASASLLLAAGLVMALGGDPAGLVSEVAAASLACITGASVILAQIVAAPIWWSALAAATGFVVCLGLARQFGGGWS